MENQNKPLPPFTLTLSLEQVNLLFRGLGKLTADESYHLIRNIEGQVSIQQQQQLAEKELKEKKGKELKADAELLGKTPEGKSKKQTLKQVK